MAFIVETGAGVPGANALATPAFVTAYLTDRGREGEDSWGTSSEELQREAIVVATTYIGTRWGSRLKGEKLRTVINGRKATGTLTLASNPLDTETVQVGLVTYRFVTTLAQENDVLIGADVQTSLLSLAAAINTGGSAEGVEATTLPSYEATASAGATTLAISAQVKGENGNEISLVTSVTGASVSGATLSGGLDQGPQSAPFPRRYLYDLAGNLVVGVPLKAKQATAEYAVRAMASALDPDPTVDDRGGVVQRKHERMGPFEEETEYVPGVIRITRPYPAADRLLSEYVQTLAGVVR